MKRFNHFIISILGFPGALYSHSKLVFEGTLFIDEIDVPPKKIKLFRKIPKNEFSGIFKDALFKYKARFLNNAVFRRAIKGLVKTKTFSLFHSKYLWAFGGTLFECDAHLRNNLLLKVQFTCWSCWRRVYFFKIRIWWIFGDAAFELNARSRKNFPLKMQFYSL